MPNSAVYLKVTLRGQKDLKISTQDAVPNLQRGKAPNVVAAVAVHAVPRSCSNNKSWSLNVCRRCLNHVRRADLARSGVLAVIGVELPSGLSRVFVKGLMERQRYFQGGSYNVN